VEANERAVAVEDEEQDAGEGPEQVREASGHVVRDSGIARWPRRLGWVWHGCGHDEPPGVMR
jgi:hypothetical protein